MPGRDCSARVSRTEQASLSLARLIRQTTPERRRLVRHIRTRWHKTREWLQRPENVLAGYIRWTDYRSKGWPNAIHIEHHKTGEQVWHPLKETINGVRTALYADAEAVLANIPRRGIRLHRRRHQPQLTKTLHHKPLLLFQRPRPPSTGRDYIQPM